MHTRDEVRTALDRNFKSLMDCLGQLTEEELTEKPVAGQWTVKDVISHVWDWGDEALRTAKAWHGARPWQEGATYDDAWSESRVLARHALPLITVVDGITSIHRRMVHFIDVADDGALEEMGRAFWGDEMPLIEMFYEMAEHYAEHAQNLAVFQVECLGSDGPADSPC